MARSDQRGDLLEELWMELQSELADQSFWSAHVVAQSSEHQAHMEQPKLIAYSIAILADSYRLQHAADPGVERRETSDSKRIDFGAASGCVIHY